MGIVWKRCLGPGGAFGGAIRVLQQARDVQGLAPEDAAARGRKRPISHRHLAGWVSDLRRTLAPFKNWAHVNTGRTNRKNRNNRQELAFISPSSVLGLRLRRT